VNEFRKYSPLELVLDRAEGRCSCNACRIYPRDGPEALVGPSLNTSARPGWLASAGCSR
jgi:hypothetical protein